MTKAMTNQVDEATLEDAYEAIRVAQALGMDTPVIAGSTAYIVFVTMYGDGTDTESNVFGVFDSREAAMRALRNDLIDNAVSNEDTYWLRKCDADTPDEAVVAAYYNPQIQADSYSIEVLTVEPTPDRIPFPDEETLRRSWEDD